MVLNRRLLKIFLYLLIGTNSIPDCGLTLLPGIRIWTMINLHYLIILSLKLQHSWSIWFWKRFLKIVHYLFLCKKNSSPDCGLQTKGRTDRQTNTGQKVINSGELININNCYQKHSPCYWVFLHKKMKVVNDW